MARSGWAASSRAAAWAPLRRGIVRSVMTTSGLVSWTTDRSCCPSAASPTTAMPGWVARTAVRPYRYMGWSSAITTRMAVTAPVSRAGGW
jgi:hypothetical protein